MISIDKDKHIKLVFKNGTVAEGIVQSWTKENATLQSIHDGSQIIVMHPEKDIQMIKIMPDHVEDQTLAPTNEEIVVQQEQPYDAIKENIREKVREIQTAVAENIDPNDLQSKSIEELRKMVVEQDRQIIANKIRQHFPSGSVGKTNFVSPFGTPQPAVAKKWNE
jgi:hypothetical protein